MSKRPKTANPSTSRLRRPAGRLRDLPIWSKLGLIMIVPTLATIVVGTNGLIDHIATANNADRARTLATLSEASGNLVYNLQNERAAAVMLLGAKNQEAKDKYLQAYNRVLPLVDQATGPYSQQKAALNDLPDNFTNLLARIDQNLVDLPGTRSQVVNGKLKLTDAAQSYEGLISDLLDIRDSGAELAADTSLSERMRAAADTARAKEFLSLRRIVVHRALVQGALTPVLRTDYIATQTGQQQALQAFQAVATREEAEFYEQTVAGSDQREADSYSGYIRGKTNESLSDAPFNADEWDAAMIGNAKLIRTVEAKLDKDVVAQATRLRDNVQRQVLIETGALLAMLLLAILFAWLVARSMARSLRELRHGALSVAQYGLPQAVARLRDPSLSNQMSPVQVANLIAEPLPVRSKDEFGQVTEAFNAVHLEAVRTAAEQAALRASVSTMFVNLARRSQILVDRLIGHLDRLERGEEDPDRLAELFQLDHLATRMRRNDENLLVLAGADSTRVQREPAALIDVLRAAQSEVEHYTRIEFGVIDRDIEVGAHAVNDLVHLVAELFDNATSFSAPDSQVDVEARRIGERVALYVEDRGIGITADQLEELNERLANPPLVDVAVSRMMGLVVVARLAARHGVEVELRSAGDRGTIAEVVLPAAVLAPRALAGRLQESGVSDLWQPPRPAQRTPFGVPLALESGAVGTRSTDSDRSSAGFAGRPFDPAPLNGAAPGNPPRDSRPLPAWSDLTGATGTNGFGGEVFTPHPTNGQRAEPLPQRRASDPWTVEGEVTGTGPLPRIPRQIPNDVDGPQRGAETGFPGIHPVSAAPASAPPATPAPPAAPVQPMGSAPPATAPPANPVHPPTSAPPVSAPTRRPSETPPVGATPAGASPTGPTAQPGGSTPAAAARPAPSTTPPASSEPRPAAAPAQPQPAVIPVASAPPAWPPLPGAEREVATPPLPETLAAALDLTAELPTVARGTSEAAPTAPSATPTPPPSSGAARISSATPAPPASSAAAAASSGSAAGASGPSAAAATPASSATARTPRSAPEVRPRFADETMELPIFRELESAWFRTRRSAVEDFRTAPVSRRGGEARPADSGDATRPTSAAQQATSTETTGSAAMANTPMSVTPGTDARPATTDAGRPMTGNGKGATAQPAEPAVRGWQTAADAGWRAARAAAEVPVAETTQTGLPKRVPMAQLVPGGVEKPTGATQRRTPEAVRGLLSAYHRGVQRGRTQPKDDNSPNPESGPAGQQSSQAPRGPAAGSGQKEQER